MTLHKPAAAALLLALVLLVPACAYRRVSEVPLTGAGGSSAALQALSRRARTGALPLNAADPGKPASLDYDAGGLDAEGASLEVEYRIESAEGAVPAESGITLVLRMEGEDSWALPLDGGFLGIGAEAKILRYRVPLGGKRLGHLSVSAEFPEGAPQGNAQEKPGQGPVFHLMGLRILPRWFGYALEGETLTASPFVAPDRGGSGAAAIILDPPARFRPASGAELSFGDVGTRLFLGIGQRDYEYRAPGVHRAPVHRFPLRGLSEDPYPIRLSGAVLPPFLVLEAEAERLFPRDPIPADPAVVLGYSRDAWRDRRYEVFAWDRFPSILIFDTADYAVQDRLFKRLAFYVEKAGFRGRLARDEEIADLHGWNAHDYRAEDLASFFELARTSGFVLNAEERELESVLSAAGIIAKGAGGYAPGAGAVISLSRESEPYLRSLFMVHEAYHGLFFVDADFRDFARERWESLEPRARTFIASYFDFLRYDTADAYLMKNELMAYCLQQPVASAGRYFGKTLAERLDADPRRRHVLPPKDEASGTWPAIAELFSSEAAAFSAYAERRWDLSAGRVWRYYQRSRSSAER